MLFTFLFIIFVDKTPAVILQKRVGLHGKIFNMYKFRTMKNDSHKLREDLESLSKDIYHYLKYQMIQGY